MKHDCRFDGIQFVEEWMCSAGVSQDPTITSQADILQWRRQRSVDSAKIRNPNWIIELPS